MLNWPDYFRTANAIARAARLAGLPRPRARALGEQLAARPLPREKLVRLRAMVSARILARSGGDAEAFKAIVEATGPAAGRTGG